MADLVERIVLAVVDCLVDGDPVVSIRVCDCGVSVSWGK